MQFSIRVHVRSTLLGLSIFCVPLVSSADGPFGVSMGDDASKIPGCTPAPNGRNGLYICKTLPKPHPDFESYSLLSPKETGVCEISALGADIQDNGVGTRTQSKVDTIAGQIATSYGQWTKKYDFVHADAMFKDTEYWLMAVSKDERSYSYLWSPGQFATKNDVHSVVVAAHATRHDVGYVFLQFDFPNIDKCIEAAKKANAAVF